jgi:hypothetical protein
MLTRPASHNAHRGGRNRKDCGATPLADAFTFDDLSAALSPLLVNVEAAEAAIEAKEFAADPKRLIAVRRPRLDRVAQKLPTLDKNWRAPGKLSTPQSFAPFIPAAEPAAVRLGERPIRPEAGGSQRSLTLLCRRAWQRSRARSTVTRRSSSSVDSSSNLDLSSIRRSLSAATAAANSCWYFAGASIDPVHRSGRKLAGAADRRAEEGPLVVAGNAGHSISKMPLLNPEWVDFNH